MKVFFLLGALAIVGLVVTGAIKVQKSSDSSFSIQVDKQKVEEDAEVVVGKGRQALDHAESALRDELQSSTTK